MRVGGHITTNLATLHLTYQPPTDSTPMEFPILKADGGCHRVIAGAGAWAGWTVSDFPSFDYTMREVRRAGEVIAGDLPWTPENEPQIRHAFEVANNFREAHAFPMRSVRCQLLWY